MSWQPKWEGAAEKNGCLAVGYSRIGWSHCTEFEFKNIWCPPTTARNYSKCNLYATPHGATQRPNYCRHHWPDRRNARVWHRALAHAHQPVSPGGLVVHMMAKPFVNLIVLQ